jgi:hypothetical protein
MTTDTPRTDAFYPSDADYWEEEAKRYCSNSQYWRERAEKAEAECAKWRKVAESLAHKPRPQIDQRKFAKQDWWDKKLANDK